MATLHSTTDRPLLISRWHDAAACSPIDCEDLFVTFTLDTDAAYAQLARLSPAQFVAQAATTAYLNELHGMNWQAEAVLARWTAALTQRGLKPSSCDGGDDRNPAESHFPM